MIQRTRDRVLSGNIMTPQDPRKARQSRSTGKLMMIPFFDSKGIIYIHWVPHSQTVNKEYYVEGLREFRKRFRRKRPELWSVAPAQR